MHPRTKRVAGGLRSIATAAGLLAVWSVGEVQQGVTA